MQFESQSRVIFELSYGSGAQEIKQWQQTLDLLCQELAALMLEERNPSAAPKPLQPAPSGDLPPSETDAVLPATSPPPRSVVQARPQRLDDSAVVHHSRAEFKRLGIRFVDPSAPTTSSAVVVYAPIESPQKSKWQCYLDSKLKRCQGGSSNSQALKLTSASALIGLLGDTPVSTRR